MLEKITLKNQVIEYDLSYTAKRNINMRIGSDSRLKVSAPKRVSKVEINRVLKDKAEWIIKNLEKVKSNKQNVLETGNLIWFNGHQYRLYYKQADNNKVIVFDEYILVYTKHIDDIDYSQDVLLEWLKDLAEIEFLDVLNKYKTLMRTKCKIPDFTFQIRNMKTRWGTCIPSKKKITLSLSLMYVPHELLEYVALHELAHFLEVYHNARFYAIIEEFMPDYKVRMKTLNKEYSQITR